MGVVVVVSIIWNDQLANGLWSCWAPLVVRLLFRSLLLLRLYKILLAPAQMRGSSSKNNNNG